MRWSVLTVGLWSRGICYQWAHGCRNDSKIPAHSFTHSCIQNVLESKVLEDNLADKFLCVGSSGMPFPGFCIALARAVLRGAGPWIRVSAGWLPLGTQGRLCTGLAFWWPQAFLGLMIASSLCPHILFPLDMPVTLSKCLLFIRTPILLDEGLPE